MLDSGKLKLMYLRLSKEDDDIDGKGQESFSIGSQRLLIQQYVESHSELGNTVTLKRSLMTVILEPILTVPGRRAF